MSKIIELLKKSGYSDRTIEYFIKKVNVGEIKNPSVFFSYTGPCGDTMEVCLKVENEVIKDAKFQAIGCAGAFASGSALTKLIKGKTLRAAKKIKIEEIVNHLESLPSAKIHCACLAKTTLEKTIDKYLNSKI